MVLESLRTTLASMQALEEDAATAKSTMTDAQKAAVSQLGAQLDGLMEERSRAMWADMDVQMEKHVERLLQIKGMPADEQDAMLEKLSASIAETKVANEHGDADAP